MLDLYTEPKLGSSVLYDVAQSGHNDYTGPISRSNKLNDAGWPKREPITNAPDYKNLEVYGDSIKRKSGLSVVTLLFIFL